MKKKAHALSRRRGEQVPVFGVRRGRHPPDSEVGLAIRCNDVADGKPQTIRSNTVFTV